VVEEQRDDTTGNPAHVLPHPGKGRSRRVRLRAERPLLAPLTGVLSSVESPVPGVFVAPLLDPALMAVIPPGS
jgi:hypothetical protein